MEDLAFITPARWGRQILSGKVVAVDADDVFQTGKGKLAGVAFDNRPYQLPMQQKAKSIRVASLDGSAQREVELAGNFRGTVREGDLVQVLCRVDRGRYQALEVSNLTTETEGVRPDFQIPAGLIRGGLAAFVLLATGLVAWLICGGAAALLGLLVNGAESVLSAVGPSLVAAVGIALMLKGLFQKGGGR